MRARSARQCFPTRRSPFSMTGWGMPVAPAAAVEAALVAAEVACWRSPALAAAFERGIFLAEDQPGRRPLVPADGEASDPARRVSGRVRDDDPGPAVGPPLGVPRAPSPGSDETGGKEPRDGSLGVEEGDVERGDDVGDDEGSGRGDPKGLVTGEGVFCPGRGEEGGVFASFEDGLSPPRGGDVDEEGAAVQAGRERGEEFSSSGDGVRQLGRFAIIPPHPSTATARSRQ